jgi:hypothetical protein
MGDQGNDNIVEWSEAGRLLLEDDPVTFAEMLALAQFASALRRRPRSTPPLIAVPVLRDRDRGAA